ncbi:MAG TPA: NUMOD4 motif-containing HNH endonuclease [Puia sp.]|nr:NUMOD4 motif-containing HNH endonuclease [Puia sp.]
MVSSKEEWKDVVGYEGLYKVSSFGKVFNYSKSWLSGRWITRTLHEQECKYYLDKKGYVILNLRKNKVQKLHKLHRIVATAFIANPENKLTVNHINGIKSDNSVANLEWATQKENMVHAWSNNLMNQKKGENHHNSKLKTDDVLKIRDSKISDYELARQYGMSRSAIQAIKKRRRWQHIPETIS